MMMTDQFPLLSEEAVGQIRTEIKKATIGMTLAEEIRFIDEEILKPENAARRPYLLEQKAYDFQLEAQYAEAGEIYAAIIRDNPQELSHLYFAGECALEGRAFADGVEYLTRCLEMSAARNDRWYVSAARKLRAYCAAKLGQKALAEADLGQWNDDDGVLWVRTDPPVSRKSIRQILQA